MNECRVRAAVPRDASDLVALCIEHARFERAAYEATGKAERLGAALAAEAPSLRAWIASVGNEAVGYATATREFSTWKAAAYLHMDCLFVRETYRNAGIGLALFNAVRDHARAEELEAIEWQTPAWNADGRRFYRRQGGSEAEKIRFELRV